MGEQVEYGPKERFWLWTMAGFGLVGVNGVFIYGLLKPDVLRGALTNPVALAFVIEALLLMVAMAYLLAKWRVSRLSWPWFVLLSFLGSMAFALPIVLLWPKRRR